MLACAGATSSPPPVVQAAASIAAEPVASAPASAATASSPAPPVEGPITFVEDDYAGALAQARARGVPLFIDTWAAWCHTCLSMKSYVFPDPALRRFAARFVWLSIDTERDENSALVTRLAVRVLPTLYVLDAATEKPVLAWPGSLTATELAGLLDDAATAATHGAAGGEAAAALLQGHQASADGRLDEAIAAYRAAIAAAPPDWPRRPQAVDALVTRLADTKQHAACVTIAADEAPKMPAGTALADTLRAAMSCANDLPKNAPERARLADLAALGEKVAADASQPILADDRSDLYDYLVDALQGMGRKDEAARVARAWSAFLDDQAARAPTPEARAVFDAHRLLAYRATGKPELAVPMLQQSERDFPSDYNPPARLGTAYLAMKRYDDALAAVKRALDRAYGPRKLRLWSLQADVYEAKGDRAAARASLRAALDFAATVQLTGGYPKLRDALDKRLAKLR